MPQDLPEQKNMIVRRVLSITGYIFAAVGLASFIFPAAIADVLFNGDIQMGYILGGALVFVGISDIVIANTIFKEKR